MDASRVGGVAGFALVVMFGVVVGYDFLLAGTGTNSEVYGISPIYPLSQVVLSNSADLKLSAGGQTYVDDIGLSGLNVHLIPYYGFDKARGYWRLVDQNQKLLGGDGMGSAATPARLVKDSVSGRTSLVAGNVNGSVYLKYFIAEDAYTYSGNASGFTKNADLAKTAVLRVNVSGGTGGAWSGNTDTGTGVDSAGVPAVKVKTAQQAVTLIKGQSVSVPAKAYAVSGAGVKVLWKSSNPAVASVSAAGKIVAKKPGKAVVTASSVNGKKATVKVSVVAKKPAKFKVSKVTVKGLAKTLRVGAVKDVVAGYAPVSALRAVIGFKSSNSKVVAVDAAGRVRALKPGKAKVSVKAGGKTTQVVVTVKK